MKVVLAEKPSVAREIAKVIGATKAVKDKKNQTIYYEGNGYQVAFAVGHLIAVNNPESKKSGNDWSKQPLPILSPLELYAIEGKNYLIGVVKKLFDNCDEIIVATDAAREGELIFRYIYHYVGCKKPFKRFWISSLTDKAIVDGFKNLKLGSDYDSLFYAAKARSYADWYVGINATRQFTLTCGGGSLGRVQTPVLKMICDRYLENKKFVSQDFWTVVVDCGTFNAKISERFFDKVMAESIAKKTPTFLTVSNIEKAEKREKTPLLHDLTSLQKTANQIYGMTADYVLNIAQMLYEQKHITYPRTGSQYISDDVFETIPMLIGKCKTLDLGLDLSHYQEQYSLNKKCVNNEKVTDHHALLPTDILPDLSSLKADEKKIYRLIVSRFFEAFHTDHIKDVTAVTFDTVETYPITVTGSIVKSIGFKAVVGGSEKGQINDDNVGDDEQTLPLLTIGDTVEVQEVRLKDGKTKPKPLLTDASLLALMENCGSDMQDDLMRSAMKSIGIGTPATRHEAINKVLKHYAVRDGKKIIPTQRGLECYEIIKNKSIASPVLTGEWELKMQQIQNKSLRFDDFMSDIFEFVKTLVLELSKETKKVARVSSSNEYKKKRPYKKSTK
jgi:DNA topoisomerase-3